MTTKTESKTILDKFTVLDRAVLYARVSGDDRGKDGRNLQGQIDMGREHCQKHGYTIIAELPEDDKGASGAEIDLPKLNQIREMAHAGQFDVLIVRELDRLSRNLAKQLIVEEELKKCNVRIEYVLSDYADTPEGQLQKHIKGAIAEYEREKIKERMVRGRYNKVKAGNVNVSGLPPFGYREVDTGKAHTLDIFPAEAEIIRFIFEQFLNGYTIGAIRDKLSNSGIPSPADFRNFGGITKLNDRGKWSRGSVARILSNSTYAGKWYYGKGNQAKKVMVKVPAIIPQDVFDLTQEKLADNKQRAGTPGQGEILLRKRCSCGECNYKTKTKIRRDGKMEHSYYVCDLVQNKKDYAKTCTQKSFRTDLVDAKVWERIEKIFEDEENLEAEIDNVEAKQDRNGAMLQSQIDAANSKLIELNQELTEFLDLLKILKKGGKAYDAVLADIDRVEETIAKVEAERNKAKGKLGQVVLSSEDKDRLREFGRKIRKGIGKARDNFNLRKALIDLLDVQVKLIREDGKPVAYITVILYDYEIRVELSQAINSARQLVRVALFIRLELE